METSELIGALTGQSVDYVRPPFGAWDENAKCRTDLIPVFWTIDTKDWYYQNAQLSFDSVKQIQENDIILMHDQYAETVEVLQLIIDYISQHGYEPVTVDEIIMN